jgi:hypothetical protein
MLLPEQVRQFGMLQAKQSPFKGVKVFKQVAQVFAF